MTTSRHELAEDFDTQGTNHGTVEESTRRVAGAVALVETPMGPQHPHYDEWLEHIESQPYQGC